MLSVLRTIWILVILQIITTIRCQDGFSEQDFLRLQQLAANDEKNTLRNAHSFNTNLLQRDLNLQTVSSPSVQYQVNDDSNTNVNFGQRSPYTRNKKVYRIKNPFQNQVEETEREHENTETQDSANGASNQYASIQYSLPPEEFLQQFRAENQYYQQTQISTPAPNLGYTATPAPQPQYSQYSTVPPPNYDNNNNQQNNQLTLEPKASHGPTFLYSTPNTFLDNAQSTASPVPSYLSTPLNNGQYSSQPSYVSSASPIFVSSSPNQQSYVSSPLSIMQTGSPDYNNRVTSTMGNNPVNYDNNDYSSSRYPINVQQYQNDYSTTTTPSPYSNQLRDSWQNNVNTVTNAAPKSLQEGVYNQYQNYPYQNNQQDSRIETYGDNGETHRIGSAPAANNMYLNYVQPNNQVLNNLKLKARDLEHETSQGDIYSSGDFGWKLNGKRPLLDHLYAAASYPRYPPLNTGGSDSSAVSKMNFHIDTSKPYNYDQISKSAGENMDQEFANAAAKAHERFKQQQQQQYQQQSQQYSNINSYGTSNVGTVDFNNQGLYYNQMDKQKNKYGDSNSNFYSYGNSQDLITSSPYFLSTPRDNQDNKPKQSFDHDKALKNIVPIDVSNVVGNSDPKTVTNLDNNSRYASNNYGTDQLDQNMRQYIRPVTDSYYKDKNTIYGFNIKTKGDDYSSVDNYKQEGSNIYAKQQQSQENNYNQGYSGASQSLNYLSQPSNNYQDNLQASSIQEPGLLRNHNQLPTDIASILKFSDIPYKLTQGLSNDALKFHNINYDQGNIPTPLPMRINQNVGSHQIDVTNSLLNKLLFNKPSLMNINKPEIDSQAGGLMSTINGFKVANPFNVDLKLVAELLKGKPTVDDSHMLTLRDQYTKPLPIKLDLNSQLQHLFKSENNGNLAPINEGLSAIGSSYMDIYNNARYPYQKYSRSQEEEESIIPIADASNTYPIGAVIEQDDTANEREVSAAADITAQGSDVLQNNFEENRPKTHFLSGSRIVGERHRHPNLLMSGRHSYQRKHPKSDTNEPYPLLKPPPPHHSPRGSHMKMENRHNRRRRLHKPKLVRVIKTEPLFEAGAEPESLETSVPILMRPPPRVAEAKSDTDVEEATV